MESKQYIGLIGLMGLLITTSKVPNETVVKYNKYIHFIAGTLLGLSTKNSTAQVGAILGWEVSEPYIYKIKYPNYAISVSAIDTMSDIVVTALGTYIGTKL